MQRSSERGIALIITMFMVLILSVIASSLVFVGQTETLSSLNYRTTSQVRYAAESGIHVAANYLMYTYVPPDTAGADPIGAFDLTTSPVRWNGADVVLTSNPNNVAGGTNYPVAAVRQAFANALGNGNAQLNLGVGNGVVGYDARARLMSMRQITDAVTGAPATLQRWEITGTGTAGGAGSANVSVISEIEVNETPLYKYAAFAQSAGCGALSFGGGGTTDSYDSTQALGADGKPVKSAYGGNVGTNGNLDENGATTTINGSLSTPRSGVGACSENNVTALSQSGPATVTGGVTQLPQAIVMKDPPPINPLPPTTADNVKKNGAQCPAGAPVGSCTVQNGQGLTIHPATATTVVTLGDVNVNANATLHLSAGVYVVNSITLNGGANLVIDGNGPVIFKVEGAGQNTPIDLSGGSVSNMTYNPTALQFIYGGTGSVKLTGGTASSSLLYAPKASVSLGGNADFYGAIVAGQVTDFGGADIHYDRNLSKGGMTVGNTTLDSFTWLNQ
jgi:hypothetical protein